MVDLILGKQKSTVIGNGKTGVLYRTFPKKLQEKIKSYIKKGGDLIITGQYVVSDLYGEYADDEDRGFAEQVLGLIPSDGDRPRSAYLEIADASSGFPRTEYSYSNTLNDKIYIVEHPDYLEPTGNTVVETLMRFQDNSAPGAVLIKNGRSKIFVMTVPLETFRDRSQKDEIMKKAFELISR